MTINELFDSVEGTRHYDQCVAHAVKCAFAETMQKKSRLKKADNLDTEKFSPSGYVKKPTTPPQETLGQLGFKKDFVYLDEDSALYAKINNLGKGKGTITILGYEKDSFAVKELTQKDPKWYEKCVSRTTITGIKAARTDLKNPYVRAKDNHWVEVELFSTFVNNIPSSFVPLGDFAKESIFTKNGVVSASAETAELDDGVQLSMAS